MGYTHHFHQHRFCTLAAWRAIAADFRTLLAALPAATGTAGGDYAHAPLQLVAGYGGEAGPYADDDILQFCGAGQDPISGEELGGEDMFVVRKRPERGSWQPAIDQGYQYCKTYRRPYDLLVCAVLLAMHRHAPTTWTIWSDGDLADWKPAIAWARRVLGPLAIPPGVIAKWDERMRRLHPIDEFPQAWREVQLWTDPAYLPDDLAPAIAAGESPSPLAPAKAS